MVLASQDPTTLRGYDIVLAISQEAINFQFQELYDKPIDKGVIPPPKPTSKFKAAPEPQHYINHNLCIFPLRTSNAVQGDEEEVGTSQPATAAPSPGAAAQEPGLRAHIACPQFRFHPTQNDILTMSIVCKSEPWTQQLAMLVGETSKPEDGLSHSYLYYWNQGKFVRTKVDGWKLEWDVSLGTHEIGDLMNVVRASKDPNAATILHPEAQKQIEDKFKGVDSKNFTAASIFCLFEDVRISSSFLLLDENGKRPEPEARAYVAQLISDYYRALHDMYGPSPTTETPFVLGYGVSARPPALEEILKDQGKDRKPTPKYLIPRRFDITTTPAMTTEDKAYTGGTLNFCIQTFRDKEEEQINIEKNDMIAGHFDHPMMSTIRASSTGLTSIHGVMTFSPGIFRNKWIASLLQLCETDPRTVFGDAFNLKLPNGTIVRGDGDFDPSKIQRTSLQNANGKRSVNSFDWKLPLEPVAYWRNGYMLKKMRRSVTGSSTIQVSYSSDFEKSDANQPQTAEAQRRTFLDFVFFNDLLCQVDGIDYMRADDGTLSQDKYSWTNATYIRIKARYKLSYQIVPSEGGTWTLVEVKDRSFFPQDGEPKSTVFWDGESIGPTNDPRFTNFSIDSDKCTTQISNFSGGILWVVTGADGEATAKAQNIYGPNFATRFLLFNYEDLGPDATYMTYDDKLAQLQAKFGVGNISTIKRRMEQAFQDLRSTVILPAGNVFLFSMVDTDSAGNLYTGMTYRNNSDLEKIH